VIQQLDVVADGHLALATGAGVEREGPIGARPEHVDTCASVLGPIAGLAADAINAEECSNGFGHHARQGRMCTDLKAARYTLDESTRATA
jgi:hypothetical protein